MHYPYIVPYRIKDDAVEVLRVFHTSRKWPTQF
jgi:toxin ParE1/3/4